MNPLYRTTAASVVTLVLVRLSDSSSGGVRATDHSHHRQAHITQLHRRNEEYGIGASNAAEGYVEEEFIPPWRDPEPAAPTINTTDTTSAVMDPTASPTESPVTSPPTEPPTGAPIATPVPIVSTSAPVEAIESIPDSAISTTFDEASGVKESRCALLPSIGNFVTEILDIEYSLYFIEDEMLDEESIQDIVDFSVEPRLHDALVEIGMGCNSVDFITAKHVMVDLSSGGNDLVGAQCLVSAENDLSLVNATACYQVWGQVEATMWFAPNRRQLQGATTPFGDREAFNEFTEWMEEAFVLLTESDEEAGSEILKASFQGYANVESVDGVNTELTQDVSIDRTAALTGAAYSADDGGISLVWGLVAIVAGVMVLATAVLIVVVRRKRNRKALFEHSKVVDNLKLDSKDDLDDDADLVDDEYLFQEEQSLPEKFKVKLEGADHDYRYIGEDRKKPIFVATERNKQFRDHLDVLKQKKEQEQREKQYESVML